MRSSASSAIAGSSAATAATGWPAKTTRSIASTACARVGAFFFSSGMSAAVSTARTPGSARARLTSMRRMRAWAWGLRRSLACRRPRGLRSATYWTWPVTFSGPSGRGMERPMPFTSRVVFITVAMKSAPPAGRGAGGLGDRGQHLRIPRAAAEIAGDTVADLFLGRTRVLRQERGGGHQHSRDAEATLGDALAHERLLQRVQRAGAPEPFDRQHDVTASLHGEHEATRDRLAIEVHRAGAAVAGPAAFFRPRQAHPLPQRVEQGAPGGAVRPRPGGGCRARGAGCAADSYRRFAAPGSAPTTPQATRPGPAPCAGPR